MIYSTQFVEMVHLLGFFKFLFIISRMYFNKSSMDPNFLGDFDMLRVIVLDTSNKN